MPRYPFVPPQPDYPAASVAYFSSAALSGRFLFPDTDATLARFEELKAGLVDHLDHLPSADQ